MNEMQINNDNNNNFLFICLKTHKKIHIGMPTYMILIHFFLKKKELKTVTYK